MPMMMWNMTTFPIERLCFDLKLEVLEELDARNVIELGKVNQGFRRMISGRRWIAFGHHVHEIDFGFADGNKAIHIKKLNSSNESSRVSLDVIRHLPFIKNIRSCNELWLENDYGPIEKEHVAFLKQLEVVNSLYGCSPVGLGLLSHLSSKIKSCAYLPSFLQKVPSIKDLVEHFIATQLNECKMVGVQCWDDHEFEFYYNAFIKTHIKYFEIGCYNGDHIVPAIQRIVGHGIPSKNPAAVLRVSNDFMDDMKATIVVFLKGYPGMKQIYGKNRQPFIALANDRWKGSGYDALTMKTLCLCFRRNINATQDCIYMLFSEEIDGKRYIYFFAFYIEPDEMIDH